MSFSADVKKELCRQEPEKNCCKKAELAGILCFCGTAVQDAGGAAIRLRTENAAVARRAYSLIRELFGIRLEVRTLRKSSAGSLYSVVIPAGRAMKTVAGGLGLFVGGILKFQIDPFLVQEECCQRAYLRGAFLGGGSVNSPERSYHFEIETHYYGLSRDLLRLMEDLEFPAKAVVRKSSYVIYLKDSEQIGDALAVMGATTSMMELYNIKIVKDVKNTVNRRVNCETANLTKTANAAAQQLFAISKIKRRRGLESLPESLSALAQLRLENPEASLAELGEMLDPPISKSGVNHRLRKLAQIADGLE